LFEKFERRLMVMAWKVVECGTRIVPWDGEVEGYVYWALLMDRRTGKELEFELFSGVYYSEEEEGEGQLNIISVLINGAVDFEEIYDDSERNRIIKELKRRYRDILQVLQKECDEFDLDI
jgi:hypothetical protein